MFSQFRNEYQGWLHRISFSEFQNIFLTSVEHSIEGTVKLLDRIRFQHDNQVVNRYNDIQDTIPTTIYCQGIIHSSVKLVMVFNYSSNVPLLSLFHTCCILYNPKIHLHTNGFTKGIEYWSLNKHNSLWKAPLLPSATKCVPFWFQATKEYHSECYYLVTIATASHSKLHITSCMTIDWIIRKELAHLQNFHYFSLLPFSFYSFLINKPFGKL